MFINEKDIIKTPAVSIITPVWNGLPYLKKAIESVLEQDFSNWEMIIADDGSTDGSREYLDTLTDDRIKIFKHEKNKGIFGNLNFLFKQASAPISQILCQDDYFFTKSGLHTIATFWENAAEDIGFARFNNLEPTKSKTELLQQEICPPVIVPEDAAVWFYVFGNIPGNLSNVSLRNSIWEKAGVFREDLPYAGDFEYWSRAAMMVKMAVRNEMVTYIRRHPGTASVFLNKKGELISQKGLIVNGLFNCLEKKNKAKRFLLKVHGTATYDSLQRDTAVRLFLKGKNNYLKELDRVSKTLPFVLNRPLRWILFLITAGGRVGRVSIAKQVLIACTQ